MQILNPKTPGYAQKIAAFRRTYTPAPEVAQSVAAIIEDVRANGDKALRRLTEKFDRVALKGIRVGDDEIARARVPAEVRSAILAARKNVKEFSLASLRKSWSRRNAQGALVGERFDPFQRVGIYIPAGTAPLVSSAVMTVAIAAAARVPEIVAVTPPARDENGKIPDALLVAMRLCGVTEIHRVGGAQAVAALAYGTETIRPVQKIFGPGNAYVVEAKRQVFGRVAIDLLPGPSEVLVIADARANPYWIAADLLAQCEHGHGSAGILVTPSLALIRSVEKSIAKLLAQSTRAREFSSLLENTALIQVANMDAAIDLANDYAAEHVAVATVNPEAIARRLTTSGAVFLGDYSPIAVGDFLAGPSHTLPTGGASKSFAGLTVDQFQRRTSFVRLDKKSLAASRPAVETFGKIEGLDAHARSVTIRLGRVNTP